MRGIGDVLHEPVDLPALPAVLVNPGVALATRDIFARLGLGLGETRDEPAIDRVPTAPTALIAFLASGGNDLEPAAISIAPIVADVLARLRALAGCRLTRMSGSGATCFALFDTADAASSAARQLQEAHPRWWIASTVLGSAAGDRLAATLARP